MAINTAGFIIISVTNDYIEDALPLNGCIVRKNKYRNLVKVITDLGLITNDVDWQKRENRHLFSDLGDYIRVPDAAGRFIKVANDNTLGIRSYQIPQHSHQVKTYGVRWNNVPCSVYNYKTTRNVLMDTVPQINQSKLEARCQNIQYPFWITI